MRWRLLLAVLVGVPGLAAGAPAEGRPAEGRPAEGRPAWVETLPAASGKLYAVGTADLGRGEAEAINRASGRAKLEVVARLRATIQGITSITVRTAEGPGASGRANGTGDREVWDEVRVETRAEELPGLVVERTYADPKAGTLFALACLDLAQARATLSARLDLLRETRDSLGEEASRKARWRLRKLVDDLTRLDALIRLLSSTGTGLDLRPRLLAERAAVEKRLDQLEGRELPALDLAKTAVALRSNIDLPPGIAAALEADIVACGLLHRDLNPDLILDLTFSGGSKGPEFISVDMDIYEGVSYRMDVRMTILDGEGTALTRPASLQIVQPASPEGMVNRFRRLFEHRLPRLLSELQAQFQ